MRYEIITFDCYGTLIDWESGISGAFLAAAARDGVTLERRAIVDAFHHEEPRVESESYRSYRAVLDETAQRVAQRLGWTPSNRGFLSESLPSWRPFPDTNAALEILVNKGCTLGILSNVDDDLLAGTRKHFTVPFDLVITAQQVQSYKPGHAHFLDARERIGNRSWLHAAQSYFHDVVPANALGIPVAWINRKGEQASGSARRHTEFPDLAAFADWM